MEIRFDPFTRTAERSSWFRLNAQSEKNGNASFDRMLFNIQLSLSLSLSLSLFLSPLHPLFYYIKLSSLEKVYQTHRWDSSMGWNWHSSLIVYNKAWIQR